MASPPANTSHPFLTTSSSEPLGVTGQLSHGLWGHKSDARLFSAFWGTKEMSPLPPLSLPEFSGPLPSQPHLPDSTCDIPARDPLVMDHEVFCQLIFLPHFFFLRLHKATATFVS